MPKYQVELTTEAFAVITIEAEDEDEAKEFASDSGPSICAQCQGWGQENVSLSLGEEWRIVGDVEEVTE